MAIPFSTPARGRGRRESLAARICPREVSFKDLSFSSQVLYFAMLEAWKILTEENTEKIEYADESCSVRDAEVIEDKADMEGDNVDNKYDASNTKYVDTEEKLRRYEANVSSKHEPIIQLPDIISEHQCPNEESRNAPDIVPITDSRVPSAFKSCGDSVSNDMGPHGLTTYQTDQISTNGLLMTGKNSPDLEPKRCPQIEKKIRLVPGTPSQKKDDLNKPHNGFVIPDKTAQIILGKPQIEANSRTGKVESCSDRQKGTWLMIGRDLSRIADGLDKRNTQETRRRFENHEISNLRNHRLQRRRSIENESLSSSRIQPIDVVDSGVAAADSERVVGIDWRTLNDGDDNSDDNYSDYEGFCHHHNIHSSNLQQIITNIALNGILYIIDNLY